MRRVLILIYLLLFTAFFVAGQISQGGRPLQLPSLKSAGVPEKVMPPVDHLKLRMQAFQRQNLEKRLKPFRFAHPFEVSFSPDRDGVWFSHAGGVDIWRILIRSGGAFSLNLIFEEFRLPEGARLFLFNPQTGFTLGAYTALNNKSSGKFAVSPVAGDQLMVQYEVPADKRDEKPFVISRVNHDFMGIMNKNQRRPLGDPAGECNIDINCPQGKRWKEVKDAVCRMIVNGLEICTGTLVNNTEEDQTPYILSAAHCYDDPRYAETTVYTFNYESPYCAPLDGDPSHSISGAAIKAQSDSLDFALTEMSLIPPPDYHPFFAGWDHSGDLPDSSVTIHHPQGDIKKIAVDRNAPVIADFDEEYTPGGFLKIIRWEEGVTEAGSSGGPLFSAEQQLIGTLTGGAASCSNPVRDYFSRFDRAWEYRGDSAKQLKYWLDPGDSGMESLDGKRFYSGEDLCIPLTHLTPDDNHRNVPLIANGKFSGYWGGTNSIGITEFMERFSVGGDEILSGISLGVGKIFFSRGNFFADREIRIKIYNGTNAPGSLIYSKTVDVDQLAPDAMNYIGFDEWIQPADTFFIGFELSKLQPADTFTVYQSVRPSEKENYYWLKQDGVWYDFRTTTAENSAMVNVFELLACNVSEETHQDTFLVEDPLDALVYPNPAGSLFTFETGQDIDPGNLHVYNLLGQIVDVKFMNRHQRKIQIDLSGNIPGVYFVRMKTSSGVISEKVTWIPW